MLTEWFTDGSGLNDAGGFYTAWAKPWGIWYINPHGYCVCAGVRSATCQAHSHYAIMDDFGTLVPVPA